MLQSELTELFGIPKDPAPYLVVIDLTEFTDNLGEIKDYEGNKWGYRIYCHELMEIPLRNAFQNIITRGLADEFITYDGCTNVRKMTNSNSWSVHSWGLAIDINAAWNKFGDQPNMSDDFVQCWIDAGFTWGGFWNTPDGMHFQLPEV